MNFIQAMEYISLYIYLRNLVIPQYLSAVLLRSYYTKLLLQVARVLQV